MRGWPPSAGEAIHTSTFLGNPVACAAALAQLDEIEGLGLARRSLELGAGIRDRVRQWHTRHDVGMPRGRGLLMALPVPAAGRAVRVAERCLTAGVLILAEGPRADVLAITPPAVITDAQLNAALDTLELALEAEGA
jgi:4-aminobutyrate aminotransferase-like enzyme